MYQSQVASVQGQMAERQQLTFLQRTEVLQQSASCLRDRRRNLSDKEVLVHQIQQG